SRLKIPEAGHGKSCNAGRLRKAEGCRPYRLRYTRFFIGYITVLSIFIELRGLEPNEKSASD
ncbi:MAG: hypothetical protein FWC50_13030, partial [Planctomycetaceae bacterium]|nr:hypothetical protein [Planctomycetaceae bacterium]